MIDYKEYAKQMRENAVVNDNGIVKVSVELWHRIADVIEEQQAEIDRLKKETKMFADIDKMYSGIKAELINIFVEALKEKASSKVMVANGKEVYGTKVYSIYEIELEKLVEKW